MKIINIGSLNLDYTYKLDHIVAEGETLAADTREIHLGGKGLNQTIALAKAGAEVYHAGHVGPEGDPLIKCIAESGADVSLLTKIDVPTGHAIIQVDKNGRNSIIILGGANRQITPEDIASYLEGFDAGDILLLQNEISCRDEAIKAAKEKGMLVCLNPSPIDADLTGSPMLKEVDFFILNETEGNLLTGKTEPKEICDEMHKLYGHCVVMLTLGSKGCMYDDGFENYSHDIYPVKAVDTTAAGDTFTGFFLGSLVGGAKPPVAIEIASKASSIAVSRPGAGQSIPTWDEVINDLTK